MFQSVLSSRNTIQATNVPLTFPVTTIFYLTQCIQNILLIHSPYKNFVMSCFTLFHLKSLKAGNCYTLQHISFQPSPISRTQLPRVAVVTGLNSQALNVLTDCTSRA